MPSDRVKDFETKRALESIATDERVESRREQYTARLLELLEEPSERNDGILENLLLELYEADALEDGDFATAEIYWEAVGDLATLGMSELYQVPVADRGGKFADASKLILLWAKQQAFVEIFALDEITTSAASGEQLKKDAAMMTPADRKALSDGEIDIKAAKVRIKAEQSNGA